ncbi:oxidoreductase [Nocardioides korecus]
MSAATERAAPVALVTGATSGIGAAAASALAEAGYRVVGTGRRTSGLTAPHGVRLVDLDVLDDAAVTSVVDQVVAEHGRLDVLVNNAGSGTAGAVEELSVAEAQHVFDVNVWGVLRTTKAALPHMRAQGSGRIVNISSVLGLIPAPFSAAYAAAKHAVEGYSESLDHEVREHGIRVVLVEPAYTRTGFEKNQLRAERSLPAYAERRRDFEQGMAESIEKGDDPAVVAKVVVKAATAAKPRLRYTAGPAAAQVSVARRLAPAKIFDAQIRKLNRLPR